MTSRKEHLYKGIGWHLMNGLFVKKCFRQLLSVGRLEHFDSDFERFSERVEFPDPDFGIPGKTRENKKNYSRGLSDQAVENLRRFYRDSDYRTLDELVKHGFLTPDDLEQYNQYPY